MSESVLKSHLVIKLTIQAHNNSSSVITDND